MNLDELIEALDQRYGNPYMEKEYGLIQEAITVLRGIEDMPAINKEDGLVCAKCYKKIGQ
jgi:hypothetical protein